MYVIGARAEQFFHTQPGDGGLEAAIGPAPRRAPFSCPDGRLLAPLPRGYREGRASTPLKGSLAPFSRRWVTRAVRLRVFPPRPLHREGFAAGRQASVPIQGPGPIRVVPLSQERLRMSNRHHGSAVRALGRHAKKPGFDPRWSHGFGVEYKFRLYNSPRRPSRTTISKA